MIPGNRSINNPFLSVKETNEILGLLRGLTDIHGKMTSGDKFGQSILQPLEEERFVAVRVNQEIPPYSILLLDNILNPLFDFIVSLSAIEHFGLGYYEGDIENSEADAEAMDCIYKWLKPGGKAYITVPIGIKRQTKHWRQYNQEEIQRKIIRQFNIVGTLPYKWDNKEDVVPISLIDAVNSDNCLCELLLILQKPLNEKENG